MKRKKPNTGFILGASPPATGLSAIIGLTGGACQTYSASIPCAFWLPDTPAAKFGGGPKKETGRFAPPAAVLSLFSVLLLAASCSGTPGKLKIIEGGFFNSQGMYTEAITAYRSSLASPAAAPYGEYGLGVVYLSLDEGEAALERFAAAEKALASQGGEEHRELRYRIHYNRGVIRFRNGDYTGAAEEFRRALETDGSHVEAKRNLELSLLSAGRQESAVQVPFDGRGDAGEGTEVLFNYLRQKEQDRWRSREWAEDAPLPGPDY